MDGSFPLWFLIALPCYYTNWLCSVGEGVCGFLLSVVLMLHIFIFSQALCVAFLCMKSAIYIKFDLNDQIWDPPRTRHHAVASPLSGPLPWSFQCTLNQALYQLYAES